VVSKNTAFYADFESFEKVEKFEAKKLINKKT
jgi:hypothetical protein